MNAKRMVLAVGLIGLIACGREGGPQGKAGPPTQACTEIGCDSRITFDLSQDLVEGRTYRVEACVDDLCDTQTLEVPPGHGGAASGSLEVTTEDDTISLRLPDKDWSGAHRATLNVQDEAGRVVARTEKSVGFERTQPNGPGCPPVCWQARITA